MQMVRGTNSDAARSRKAEKHIRHNENRNMLRIEKLNASFKQAKFTGILKNRIRKI
jgi:hypothetical protein